MTIPHPTNRCFHNAPSHHERLSFPLLSETKKVNRPGGDLAAIAKIVVSIAVDVVVGTKPQKFGKTQ